MVRTITGFAIFGRIGIVAVKMLFGVIGFAFSLLWTLLSLAAVGFVLYLILRIISPDTARRVRETVAGQPQSDA